MARASELQQRRDRTRLGSPAVLMTAGEIEAGLVQADTAHRALKGEGTFAGNARAAGIRAVASLYPNSCKTGALVTHVENGREALEALRRDSFDLLMMDVQMPVLDGVEATRAIRAGQAGEEARGIPIIALTAYAMAGDKDIFLKAGMNAYVSKPVGMAELLPVIGYVLGGPERGG
jgi:CheY-like chemotaxis protein